MSAVSFDGPLAADAEARRTRAGENLLSITVAVPCGARGQPVHVRAVKPYGTGVAADIACKVRSRELRRGVRVVVTGNTLSWCRGIADLGHVDALHTPDLQRPNHTGSE